jgi:hypothetical protein
VNFNVNFNVLLSKYIVRPSVKTKKNLIITTEFHNYIWRKISALVVYNHLSKHTN